MNIASIAESEACNPDDYGKVARVILNRIDQDMPLGMDSTVAYGFNTTGSKLTDEQLEDGSNPYNTRVNKGLPPTPISNPGDSAIQAAMNLRKANGCTSSPPTSRPARRSSWKPKTNSGRFATNTKATTRMPTDGITH